MTQFSTDMAAFKNIRTQLFQLENEEKAGKKKEQIDYQKYIMVLSHLFESMVGNTNRMVEHYSSQLIA